MSQPEATAIAAVRHGRGTIIHQSDECTEYSVRFTDGRVFIVTEFADSGTMIAEELSGQLSFA